MFYLLRRYLLIDFVIAIIILKLMEWMVDGIHYIADRIAERQWRKK